MENPTRDNAAVLFLDLQDEIVKNSRTLPIERLRRTTGALAKLAALHKLPTFLSAVPPGGAFLANVLQPLNNPQPRLRMRRLLPTRALSTRCGRVGAASSCLRA
jgi:hypothetical protein